MKYLSICTTKDSFSMLPPAQARQILEATMTWSDQQKKKGKIVESYSGGASRSIVICEHPSFEDFNQTIASMPMVGFIDFEIYPLADLNVTMKAYIEALKSAEKMFPAREMAGVR